MNRNWLLILLFLAIGTIAIQALLTEHSISNYKNAYVRQGYLMRSMRESDSSYLAATRKYSQVINTYLSKEIITKEGKNFTAEELVNGLSAEQQKNDSLHTRYNSLKKVVENLNQTKACIEKEQLADSRENKSLHKRIARLADSLERSVQNIKHLKSSYGIGLHVESSNVTKKTVEADTPVLSKMDSALLIFPYFKDRIYKDSSGNWVIITYDNSSKPDPKKKNARK